MTPESARTLAEAWTTLDKAKRDDVLAAARESVQNVALITLAIDGIYGPKAGPQYVRQFLRLLTEDAPT